jgi:uncharacterized protein (TIGR03083 family)
VTDAIPTLRASVSRLRAIVEGLEAKHLEEPGYPSEWTVADVLSHLGSGAVLSRARVDDVLAGRETPADLAPSVWDEWNAKSPEAKAAGALVADQALLDRIDTVTASERARFRTSIGPLDVDFDGFLRARLNEHAVHTWDVAVAFDPDATVAPDATAVVVDNLERPAGWSGKPSGIERRVQVRTTAPVRHFTISIDPDAVSMKASVAAGEPDLELPAEALIRLVYGRFDTAHTPPLVGDEALVAELRQTFRGF